MQGTGGAFFAGAKYQDISHNFPHTVAKMYAMAAQHKFVFPLGRRPFFS